MLPIITRLVPDTSVYGIFDLLRVLVSFGSAFAVLGMYDAMFRMFFDNENRNHKIAVCSSSLFVVLLSSALSGLSIVIFSSELSKLLFSTDEYRIWVILIGVQTTISSLGSIIKAPTRMQNKRRVFVIMNIAGPTISYSISVAFILLIDPLFGLIIGGFSSALFKLLVFWKLNRSWFNFKRINTRLIKDMMKIGVPLMPTFLIYWVFSSFDRIMISNMIGTSYNGIYAVGARIAQVSQLIYTGFVGGWSYFNYSTMKDRDHPEIVSKVFEYLGVISMISMILIMPLIPLVFKILFTGDYVTGHVVTPYLFLSPLLLMLFQTSASQLLIVKKSYWVTISLTVGAGLNVMLNYLLIPILSIEGAAIATLLGYLSSVIIVSVLASVKKLLKIHLKFLGVSGITTVFFFLSKTWLNSNIIIWYIVSFMCLAIILLFYKNDISKFKKRLSRKRS